MKKLSSIIDIPKMTLPSTLWLKNGDTYELREDVSTVILDTLNSTLKSKYFLDQDNSWIKEVNFVGSSATYQYNKLSDIDIHFVIDWDNFYLSNPEFDPTIDFISDIISEMHHFLNDQLTNFYIDKHIVTFYPEETDEQDYYGDAVYEMLSKEWKVVPTKIPSDYSAELVFPIDWKFARDFMNDFDSVLGELKRDLQDYFRLCQANFDNDYTVRIRDKAIEIENGIVYLAFQLEQVHNLRKYGYSFELDTSRGFTKSRSYSAGNIIWKILENYNYVNLIIKLRNLNNNKIEEVLSYEEIEQILDLVNTILDIDLPYENSIDSLEVPFNNGIEENSMLFSDLNNENI